MNYYCYVAGMPDVQQDNVKSAPGIEALTEELSALLSKRDLGLLNVLRRGYDNVNMLAMMRDRGAELKPLGLLSREDWIEVMDAMDECDDVKKMKDGRVLPYMVKFYGEMRDEETRAGMEFPENRLSALYYEYGMGQGNGFVSRWFEFNLNVNNILTALTCRKHGWDIRKAVVGSNGVAECIVASTSARDFNLRTEIDYFDAVAAIADVANLLERERRLDVLKWKWLEENTVFEYFSVERILSYWLQCELMHRWDGLTMERGTEIFRRMIDDLKRDVRF